MDGIDLDSGPDVKPRLLEAQAHTASAREEVYPDGPAHIRPLNSPTLSPDSSV